MHRLSTGSKINYASDNAANFMISKGLTVQQSGLKTANNNIQMATSILNTADGALNEMTDLTLRIRDLALQSSNGGYSSTERSALQQEVNQLTSSINQLLSGTKFNNFNIFGKQTATPSPINDPAATPATVAFSLLSVEEPALMSLAADDTVYVSNAQELYDALNSADALNNADYKVELTSNIDLNDLGDLDGTGSNWISIARNMGAFEGTFNGNGYTISNLTINKSDEHSQGFFGGTSGATIKNVNLANVSVAGGGLVAV